MMNTLLMINMIIFMKKFKHFRERALWYESRKKYEKALEIRKRGLELENLSNLERGDLLMGIGGTYLYLNNEAEAAKYFDKAFEVAEHENFPYDKQYEKVIKAYIDSGRSQDAKRILDELIARQSYDKRFKRLEKLKAEMFP